MGWEGRIVVFVGPSFPPHRVTEFLPGAEVRFPIKRGDLDAIVAPAVVAVTDGVFDAELAISPREIRHAISRGLRVDTGRALTEPLVNVRFAVEAAAPVGPLTFSFARRAEHAIRRRRARRPRRAR